MKNAKLRISAALLALIMCFGLLVSCGNSGITVDSVQKDPYAAITDGYHKYADALSEKYGDACKVFEDVAKGTGTYELGVAVPDMGDVNISAVADCNTGAYSGKATLSSEGVSMDVSLWGDKNNVAVNAPFILGETTYGLKLDTLETDLESSELLSSLTGMSFDELKASLESEAGIKWDDLKGVLSVEKWTTAFDKYMTDAGALMKAKEYTVAEESVKIGETDVAAISVQYVQTAEDSEKVAGLAFDMVESVCGDIIAASGMSIDDLKNQMMTESATAEVGDVSTKVFLNKSTGAIVSMNLSSENMKMDFVLGEDASKKIDITADYELTVEGQTTAAGIVIKEVTEEGKGGFDISVTGKAEGEENTVALNIVRNDADGKYEIKVSTDGEEMGVISGTLTYSADEFKASVDSVTVDGETVQLSLTISAKAGGTVEAVPEYTNILTASADELEGLMTIIGSMMGGYDDEYLYGDLYGDDETEVTMGEDSDIDEYLTIEDITAGMTDEELAMFELLCDGMTEEEIVQSVRDLAQMGYSIDDIIGMMME